MLSLSGLWHFAVCGGKAMENTASEKKKKLSVMPHIQIESDISLPFTSSLSIQLCEMLTFRVTEGVMVTFKHAVQCLMTS